MITVDWTRGVIRNAPRKNRPNQRETFYPVMCDCGYEYELNAYNARKSTCCKFCQTVKAGRVGWQTTVARHGRSAVIAKMLQNQQESWAEATIRGMLEELGKPFEKQVFFEPSPDEIYVIDFVVSGKAVEVNGWGHRLEERQRRDARLSECWPGQVLFITTAEIREDLEKIRNLLADL